MSAPNNINQASSTQGGQNTHYAYSSDSSDEVIPFRTSLEELQAAPDPFANWRSRNPPLQADAAPNISNPWQRLYPEYADDEKLIEMGILYPPLEDDTDCNQEETGQPEPSTEPALRGDSPPTLILPCSICFQEKDVRDLCILPCAHDYCAGCINRLFETRLSDESPFPPRCCPSRPPIPFDDARIFLRTEFIEIYERKQVELQMPRHDRTYCHLPGCRTFIDPATILGTIATCPTCTAITCSRCKNGEHPGRCQYNANTPKARASRVGRTWTTCYRCRRAIERTDGCLYIRCRCGVLVCCKCSRPWNMSHRHEDDEVPFHPRAFPVLVSDSVITGPSDRPLPEEGVGNDKGSDGDADDEEEDEIGELIDVYYDQRDTSAEHEAFQREVDEQNQVRDRDEEERDVFYDANEYITQETDESDGGVNLDPSGTPIGQPVFNADAPFDPGAEGQAEQFVEELLDEQRQQLGEEQTEEAEEMQEIEESEVEQIGDYEEIAERVLRGLGIDCQHLQWREVFGLGRCESCIQDPPGRRYRCTNCGIIVCRACREEVVRYILVTGRLYD